MNGEAKRVSRSGLLLTETLIAILFFSIASAICLQLFVKTHQLERKTQALDLAVTQATSVEAILSECGRISTDISAVRESLSAYYQLDTSEEDASVIRIYFDKNYRNSAKQGASFCLLLSLGSGWESAPADNTKPALLLSELRMYDLSQKETEELYGVTISTYHPAGEEVANQ